MRVNVETILRDNVSIAIVTRTPLDMWPEDRPTSPVGDIWWTSFETTCSNLFNAGPRVPQHTGANIKMNSTKTLGPVFILTSFLESLNPVFF